VQDSHDVSGGQIPPIHYDLLWREADVLAVADSILPIPQLCNVRSSASAFLVTWLGGCSILRYVMIDHPSFISPCGSATVAAHASVRESGRTLYLLYMRMRTLTCSRLRALYMRIRGRPLVLRLPLSRMRMAWQI
jgi:hypothetical protein